MLTEIFLDTYYNYICFMFQNIEIQVKKRSKFSKKRLFLLSYGQTRYTTVTNYYSRIRMSKTVLNFSNPN